jgi:hypothetical protein
MLGADEFVNDLSKFVSKNCCRFIIYFSSVPFPDYQCLFSRGDEEAGGYWYHFGNRKGWLCPVLFRYFSKAPQKIYVKAE